MLKKLLGFILVVMFCFAGFYIADAQNQQLSDSVLRLHVIANSDDPADQALKIEVKDAVVTMMTEEFKDISDADIAKDLARQRIPQIQAVAEAKIKSLGYDYPVTVYVGKYDFPTKSYGNLVFPQGEYQAVRIIIGEGQGKNWWCVLFPPLCLVSSSDKGMSLDSPQKAQVTFKCLELIHQGVRIVNNPQD